jgi:hypothetical protein
MLNGTMVVRATAGPLRSLGSPLIHGIKPLPKRWSTKSLRQPLCCACSIYRKGALLWCQDGYVPVQRLAMPLDPWQLLLPLADNGSSRALRSASLTFPSGAREKISHKTGDSSFCTKMLGVFRREGGGFLRAKFFASFLSSHLRCLWCPSQLGNYEEKRVSGNSSLPPQLDLSSSSSSLQERCRRLSETKTTGRQIQRQRADVWGGEGV